jgi:hypothetical protein
MVSFSPISWSFIHGQRVTVSIVNQDSVQVRDEKGREHMLPLDRSNRFQVYETQSLPLAPGDKIRITQNGFTADEKHRLNNGAVYQVKGFTKKSAISNYPAAG